MGKVMFNFAKMQTGTDTYFGLFKNEDHSGYFYPAADYEALEADTSKLRQAIGLATTCAPKMEMDVTDPIGMMQTVCAEFKVLEAKLAALVETLTILRTELDMARVTAKMRVNRIDAAIEAAKVKP